MKYQAGLDLFCMFFYTAQKHSSALASAYWEELFGRR